MAMRRSRGPGFPPLSSVVSLLCVAAVLFGEVRAGQEARDCPRAARPAAGSALSRRAMEDIPDAKLYTPRSVVRPHASFEGDAQTLRVNTAAASRKAEKIPMSALLRHIRASGTTSSDGKAQYSRRQLLPLMENIIFAPPGEHHHDPCSEVHNNNSRLKIRLRMKKKVNRKNAWKDINSRQEEMVYLGSLVDLSTFDRRVYIDGGSRQYDSSVGSWFKSVYPEAQTFYTYAFDVDGQFRSSYADKKDVKFHQCAMWVRDDTITIGGMEKMLQISNLGDHTLGERYEKKKVLQGGVSVGAMDTAEFLMSTVTKDDFVVMKMDIEGAEFEVIDHLVDTGAIFLIDELFLECHDDAWSGMRVDKKRGDCVTILHKLRSMGMWVHDWF